MRETGLEMVGDRFGDPFWKTSDKVHKCCQICSNSCLEKMKLDGFWVVVAPFGLGLAVVRGTGPKFHYRPLFGHMGPPGAQNGPFLGFLGSLRVSGQPLAYCCLLSPGVGGMGGALRYEPWSWLELAWTSVRTRGWVLAWGSTLAYNSNCQTSKTDRTVDL